MVLKPVNKFFKMSVLYLEAAGKKAQNKTNAFFEQLNKTAVKLVDNIALFLFLFQMVPVQDTVKT